MKNRNFVILLLSVCIVGHTSAQSGDESYLIGGITLHTAVGKPIEEAALGVRNGKIEYAGKLSLAPAGDYDRVYDKGGAHIYPALIAPNTTLGLTEIFAVRATRDYSETGELNPNVRTLIAFNAESDISATVLANGILLAQAAPRGGTISGTSSVMALTGWNWEDAAYKVDDGIHMRWPRMYKSKSNDDDDPVGYVPDEKYAEKLHELKQFFYRAKAYANKSDAPERDLKMESMRGVFDGRKRLYVDADFIKEIREIIAFKKELQIPHVHIVGGYDSWMAAELLRENDMGVIVRRVNSLPRFAEDPVDAPFRLPAILAEAGVLYCLQMDGDMETMQNRNLPFNAGTAIGYGLHPDEALKACTINTARILGIDHRTGSLEKGKDANFIIAGEDIFDIRFSSVKEMYYQGTPVNIDTRQEQLYEKYRAKYTE